jgi:gentisate 1,2-dioxygenase
MATLSTQHGETSPAVTQPTASGTTDGRALGQDPPPDRWSRDARFFEYSAAVDPIGSGHIPAVPITSFAAGLHSGGPTRVIPLDLSEALGITRGPATSPGLLASFVRITAGDAVELAPNASSQLLYVLGGDGSSTVDGGELAWATGDFLTLPAGGPVTHRATTDTTLYWVHDQPLLSYLGVVAAEARFAPTRFPRADAEAQLVAIAARPGANQKSRVSVLLANRAQEQTLTITHVLWAMFGLLPVAQVQRPHRHQSVALDLILDCRPGCYSLLGAEVDGRGEIIDPVRVDWEAGGAFVTPPGMWHAHVNESGSPAHLIPIQDAGLHTHLRSLDIRFVRSA